MIETEDLFVGDESEPITSIFPVLLVPLFTTNLRVRYLPNRDKILFSARPPGAVQPVHFEVRPCVFFAGLGLDLDTIRTQAEKFATDVEFRAMWTATLKFRKTLNGPALVTFDDCWQNELKRIHRRVLKNLRREHGSNYIRRPRGTPKTAKAARSPAATHAGGGDRKG